MCVWSSLTWYNNTPPLHLLNLHHAYLFPLWPWILYYPFSFPVLRQFSTEPWQNKTHNICLFILPASFFPCCYTNLVSTGSLAWIMFSNLYITVIRHHEKRVTYRNLFCVQSFRGLNSNSCNNLSHMLGLVLSSESHIFLLCNNIFVQCDYVLLSLV